MSLQRANGHSSSSSSHKKHKTEESDEELLMVPDMEAAGSTCVLSSSADDGVNNPELDTTQNGVSTAKRRRGRNPVDKEYRSLKRLLRNRVSAQQARERKKVYVSDLESRANELQNNNDQLEEKISTLTNENTMLRKIIYMKDEETLSRLRHVSTGEDDTCPKYLMTAIHPFCRFCS